MSGAPVWHLSAPGRSPVLLCGSIPGSATSDGLDPDIEGALAASRLVWCEFPPTEELATSPLLAVHGLSSEALSNILDEPLAHHLAAACEQLGVERATIESTRPWLAAQIIDGAHSTVCGIDSSARIDTVIARRAADLGVPVRYEYPTADEAFGLFSGLRRTVELDYLRWTLDRSIHAPGSCTAAAIAWEDGSYSELTDETNMFARTYPDLFEVLVVARNQSWADRIHAAVHAGDPAIVVVGAGHLVGAAAIPALLDDMGITIRVG